ncbi:CHASE domain-containing protein [Pontixanthobacter sp.]|uniref:CHASE domain-containing protein n=1 Tax=Pontixanthobacter sp. TaxID=2792078 RepID=UPI003C7D7D9C
MAQSNTSERRARRLLMDFPRAVPVAIFLLIAAITGFSVFAIERGEHQREHAELRERAQAVASALERRGGTTASYLRAGAALFSTSGQVTPELFDRFVENIQVDSDYRGSDGLGWAELLRANETPSFEASYFERTGQTIKVFPSGSASADSVVPVTYLRPDTERNRRASGYDMYSDPVRRAAIDAARETMRPMSTGKLVLVQEGGIDAAGFIIYMPVFAEGISAAPPIGFVYSPFNAQEFLASALELETRGGKGLRLYDGFDEPDLLLAEFEPAQKTDVTVTEPVTVANRVFILEVESARGNSLSALSMLTLLFGMLVASLLIVVARLLTRQALEDRASLEWLEEQNSIRNSLTRELNHRVKNTLANVLSIIALTRRRSKSLDSFADSLDGRIRALSATHDLLTQSDWGTTPIRDLISAEMAPYAKGKDTAVVLDGPDVEVAPNDALSLGLAIHELATNAAKYGALSQSGGRVSIQWMVPSEGLARLEWQESGGPEIPAKRTPGFGINLIEKIVAHELSHPVDLVFDPAGVRCTLTVPLRQPSDFAIRASRLR